MDEIKFLNYVGHLLQRNGKRVKIFIPQRTLCTDGRHRCDKPVNVLRRSFHISLKKLLILWRDEEGSEINEFCLKEG